MIELKVEDMPNNPVSFKQAAITILERFSEPKSAKEITDIAIEEGLIESEGKTPEATMAAPRWGQLLIWFFEVDGIITGHNVCSQYIKPFFP